jgi:hypothetical protein
MSIVDNFSSSPPMSDGRAFRVFDKEAVVVAFFAFAFFRTPDMLKKEKLILSK